ncbi:MAG: hypothetical protein EOM31_11460 [Bacteroidia bacterium]|nr:hypothetical protein [Bacteroidia bacterium]
MMKRRKYPITKKQLKQKKLLIKRSLEERNLSTETATLHVESLTCSIAKLGEQVVSEDAVRGESHLIAVSDGAGGGGVYAERWSAYLLQQLPATPITNFEELDRWMADIWESFYNECEADAKQVGGMLLDKFYDEGSFATLAAVWRTTPTQCVWMSYGDSVVFHYNPATDVLEHSFTQLVDFAKPPFLLNCKDEACADGFRTGIFQLQPQSIVFAATDAVAHYLLLMYQVSHRAQYAAELQAVLDTSTKQRLLVQQAMDQQSGTLFKEEVLSQLLVAANDPTLFAEHLGELKDRGVLAHDDYSFACLCH